MDPGALEIEIAVITVRQLITWGWDLGNCEVVNCQDVVIQVQVIDRRMRKEMKFGPKTRIQIAPTNCP
jgi:hypothetical protein